MKFLVKNISSFGNDIDQLNILVSNLTFFWMFLFMFLILYFVFKYRKSNPKNSRALYNSGTGLDFYIVISMVVLIFLSDILIDIKSDHVWNIVKGDVSKVLKSRGGVDLEVKITAMQYAWSFHYPGPDNKWDTDDDKVSGHVLRLPVDSNIVFHLTSKDVIHSFWVKSLRLKQDAIPGRTIKGWFNIDSSLVGSVNWSVFINAEEVYKLQQSALGVRELLGQINNSKYFMKLYKNKYNMNTKAIDKSYKSQVSLINEKQKLLHVCKEKNDIHCIVDISKSIKVLKALEKQNSVNISNSSKYFDSFVDMSNAMNNYDLINRGLNSNLSKYMSKLNFLFKKYQLNGRLYEIACAEMCGMNHGIMNAWMVVDSKKNFNEWYNSN